MIDNIVGGFGSALLPTNLLVCLIGVTLGTLIGMLPGLGSSTGVAVLLPLTLTMEPLPALIMLAGVYYGVEYGGTISAVLISTPGDGASMVTVLEGHQMALRGLAGQALAIAAVASFVAGTLSVVALSLTAPVFATAALQFGSPEMFALMVLGLATVGGIVGRDRAKGYAMAGLGAVLGLVGLDAWSGVVRFSFGMSQLHFGLNLIAIIVGIVAIGELVTRGGMRTQRPIRARFRDLLLRREDLRRSAGAIGRGGTLGFLIGCLPGAGPTLSTFFSYAAEKRIARTRKSRFGRGDIRGVAGPEAANNAAVNGAMVPTLTLGIPGSGTTAILLAAFIAFGLRPGPLLLDQQSALVWGLIASFYIGNLMLLILNLPLAPVFASLLRIRYTYIYPVVLAIAVVAAYSVGARMLEAWIAVIIGVLGYFMKRFGYPVAPVVLGLILGAMMETHLRRSLSMGIGSPTVFFERPIAMAMFVIAFLVVVLPAAGRLIRARRDRTGSTVAAR